MSARSIDRLRAPAEKAERRLRLARALAVGAKALVASLVLVAIVLSLRKTGLVGERTARILLVLSTLGTLVTVAIAYARKLPRFSGAVALDRYHALSDRLSSALSFMELPIAERTPFMDAAIDDALSAVPKVDPKRAVPFRSPRETPIIALLTIAVALIAVFEVRKHIQATSAKTIDPVDVTADDLDAMRDFLKDMQQNAQSDDAKDATQQFNQLIEDLAAKRLDRTEAFRRMQALEDKLLEGRDADAKSLEDALQKIGEEMKKSELTKPAGEALDNKNLVDAEKQLHDLAKKLRENGSKIDKDQLEKMREALKQASADQAKRQEALDKKRDELEKEKSLLQEKQKQADAGVSDQEKSLLEKKDRELERLNRDSEQQKAVGRQLDRLDRELDKAAEDLMKDMGLSAQDLDQSAEDINRMAQEEMSDEQKEQLKQKLEELRELMRQQGQGGQQQMVRLRKFQQHAQGKGQGGGQGQEGQGQDQDGQEGQEGQDGQQGQNGQSGQGQNGQSGQGQNGQQGGQGQQGQSGQASNQGGQNGQGQNGQGQGGQGGQGGQSGQGQGSGKSEVWVVGPNGQKILMISQGQGQGSGSGSGNGGNGTGQSPGSQGYGSGHDEHVQGQASNMKTGTEDTQVAGQDTGQGGSRSEVIQGAAERGFASKGYTRVYTEYHTVAEEALGKDEIPGGYRFYVRRYFELIRPRDDQK